jgi:multimeric flavodoxin WrbA
MSKKVLIISSSPRKQGNSDILCDEFVRGAADGGNVVEKVFLKDKNINYCTGCGYCFNQRGKCSQKDDMEEMKQKLIAADAIVMATPVYFYTMAGQLKTFIDRNCFFYTQLSGKDFYFIMTAADGNKSAMDRTIEEFRGYLSCLDNAVEKGIIYGTGAWNKGDIQKSKAVEEAYNMGKTL